MNSERRLSDPGRAHDHGGGSGRNAAAQQVIQLGDAARDPIHAAVGFGRTGRTGVQGLHPGMHHDPRVRDLVGMASAQEAAAPELEDLDVAFRPPPIGSVIEGDQAVDHGLLG